MHAMGTDSIAQKTQRSAAVDKEKDLHIKETKDYYPQTMHREINHQTSKQINPTIIDYNALHMQAHNMNKHSSTNNLTMQASTVKIIQAYKILSCTHFPSYLLMDCIVFVHVSSLDQVVRELIFLLYERPVCGGRDIYIMQAIHNIIVI